ncbi:hypothetical protein NN561_015516 [Cricetulus griseus]
MQDVSLASRRKEEEVRAAAARGRRPECKCVRSGSGGGREWAQDRGRATAVRGPERGDRTSATSLPPRPPPRLSGLLEPSSPRPATPGRFVKFSGLARRPAR